MHKREVAHLLRTMGALLEIKGEEGFKVRAYQKAAETIERGDFPLSEMATAGTLLDIPNVGRNLEPKIRELVLTGRSSFLEHLVEEVPSGLLELLRVPGIGPKTARTLYESLGVAGLDDLQHALEAHKVQGLPGMGKKREDIMAKGLSEVRKYAGRVSIGVALPVAYGLLDSLASKDISGMPVGELRRSEETVAELEILLKMRPQDSPLSLMRRSGIFPNLDHEALNQAWDGANRRFVFGTGLGVPLAVYFERESGYWPRATWLTGPKEYVGHLRRKASKRGLSFEPQGLFCQDSQLSADDEDSLSSLLGTSLIPPEVRHREEFIQKAEDGQSIRLIDPKDLKGDLHTHTVWSDGVGSVEDMVTRGIAMGYSYMAITDHATFMKMIEGVTPERVDAYLKDIQDSQRRHPDFRVYAGVEVDIARDGSLRLSHEDLARFDVVVASVHQDISDAGGDLVRRLARAAENPHVDIIGHPTGRLLGRRPGTMTGMEPLFQAAERNGTMLEINASPERMDLPETLARQAYDLGAGLVVSTDSHSPGSLDGAQYGVLASARRAGLPPSAVKNTLPEPPWLLGKPS